MQTRRQGTKGPGQGDSAVAQDKIDGVEDALEDPVEAKPSSTTDL